MSDDYIAALAILNSDATTTDSDVTTTDSASRPRKKRVSQPKIVENQRNTLNFDDLPNDFLIWLNEQLLNGPDNFNLQHPGHRSVTTLYYQGRGKRRGGGDARIAQILSLVKMYLRSRNISSIKL